MRNTLLTLAVALFITTGATAQLTLTSSSYPASVTGTDSLRMTTAASTFPSLSAMANATWDMSTVTDSSTAFFAYRVPTAVYQFADSNNYTFDIYSYKGNVQSAITSTGILEYGINIQQANYSLTSVTGGATDSLYIPTQQDTFNNAQRIKIAFPATYHSSWSSVYNTDFSFEISVSPLFSHTPGITRTYTTEKDSVIGWGKMRVKDASGSPSPYFDVLQVQTTIMTIDSFFLSGSATAAAPLLTDLGLTQGQKDTTYQQSYYRVEEVTPLAQVTFKDGTFSTPTSATTHVQRIYTNEVPNVLNGASVKVYPNPVSGQSVTVSLPATGGAWSYELTDVTGRKVQDGMLPSNSGQAVVSLPSSLIQGIYYLKINNNGTQVSITPVDVLR